MKTIILCVSVLLTGCAIQGPLSQRESPRQSVNTVSASRWERLKTHVSENRVWYIALAALAVGLTQSEHLNAHSVEHSPTDVEKCGIQSCTWQERLAGLCPSTGLPFCEP